MTGSPGSFDLNFHVSNNMTAWPTQNIYFFSVRLSVDAITGSPSNFVDNRPMDANWFNNGGSATDYNNTWVDSPLNNDFLPGQSLSGFIVRIPDLIAPSSVAWSALANSNGAIHPYTGGGNFNPNANPGFEGLASPVVIPEPSAFVIALIGLRSLGGRDSVSRRR